MKPPRAEDYSVNDRHGRHLRTATRVIFPDGVIVDFTERMPKKLAIAQAIEQRQKHPDSFPPPSSRRSPCC